MSLNQNGLEVFNLQRGNLRQRIVGIFGNNYNERLVPVEESTTLLKIHGFVGKPEYARKTRGEQFFFVNNRFIKDAYLHHAVQGAFEELLPQGTFASYFLFLDIDPKRIDINIHPTKTEIKFDDDRSVYAIVRAAVKRSLGQFSVIPVLDFERESNFDLPHAMRNAPVSQPQIKINPDYNPFRKPNAEGWQQLYEVTKSADVLIQQPEVLPQPTSLGFEEQNTVSVTQLYNRYLLTKLKSGFVLIDQQAAHERVLFDYYMSALQKNAVAVQQKLFPVTLETTAADADLINDLLEDFKLLGFHITAFGLQTFVVNGTPTGITEGQEKEIIDSLLEQYKNNQDEFHDKRLEILARIMAKKTSIKAGQKLEEQEMKHLLNELFSSGKPSMSIDGKAVIVSLTPEDLAQKFK